MAKARGGKVGPEQGQTEYKRQLKILKERIDELETQFSRVVAGSSKRIDELEMQFSRVVAGSSKVVDLVPQTIPDPDTRAPLPVDGGGSYWVIDPRVNYRGKSYSEWASDWFNWFVSVDADKRTFGPVVFLRSKGLPSKITGANMSDIPERTGEMGNREDTFSSGPGYTKEYVNDPNIKIGGDRIQIFSNQAVFVPIITAYELSPPARDWGSLHEFTEIIIDYGDNPPGENQLTINNQNVQLPPGRVMEHFRITTPIFTAVIPEAEYGRSIKDFLETPVVPGNYPAIVGGYFVMLRFSEGRYWVHSWASGPRETPGPYFSELLYQIEVLQRKPPIGVRTASRPARNDRFFKRVLKKKQEDGEFGTDSPETRRLEKFDDPNVFRT
jgi:hypothetical protein